MLQPLIKQLYMLSGVCVSFGPALWWLRGQGMAPLNPSFEVAALSFLDNSSLVWATRALARKWVGKEMGSWSRETTVRHICPMADDKQTGEPGIC